MIANAYQVQIRSLCPDWTGRKKSDNLHADVAAHRSLCKQDNCGYSNRDYYVYNYVELGELMALLQNQDAPAESPRKGRAKAAAVDEKVACAAPEEDLFGLDEDLLGGTSMPSADEDLL